MIKFRTYTEEEIQDANFHPCRACQCPTKILGSTTRCMDENKCGGGYYTDDDDVPVVSEDRKALEALLSCLKLWPAGAGGFESYFYTDDTDGIVQGLTTQDFNYLVTIKETMEKEKKVSNESVDCP